MKRIIVISALAVIAVLLWVVPVFATDPPDSDPTISDIHANVYLVEEDAVLIYGLYNIPYTTIPDDDASKTYSIRLIDTDNVTQLGVVTPFPLLDSGYGEGVFGLYFSASDNLTVGQPYIIRISQSPAFFDTPESWDYVMSLSDWTSFSEQEDNQAELEVNVIMLARELEATHDDITLLESSIGGTVLYDPTGEIYFRGAIYGIQVMAPDLFLLQSLEMDATDREWETTQYDSYGNRFDDTFIGAAVDDLSEAAGTDPQSFMTLLFLFPLVGGSVIVSHLKFKKAEPGWMVAALFLILAALMGWVNMALFALTFQALVIYIGYLWFYSRSTESLGGKSLNFFIFTWFMSVMICLICEGSWFGSVDRGIINDLTAFNVHPIAGLIPLPVPNLNFFQGLLRVFLWDYSFYTGSFEFLRWLWLGVFTGSAVWAFINNFTSIFANFLRIR